MPRLTSIRLYVILLLLVMITVVTLFATAYEDPAPSTEEQYRHAIDLYYQGEFEQSLELMATIVRNNPANDRIRFDFTYLLREAGQLREAIYHLTHLVNTNPHQAAYRNALLATSYLAGNYYRVLSLKGPEDSAEAAFWKGLAAYDLGVYVLAKDHLEKAVALSPFQPLAYYFLGLINLAEKDYAQAKTNLTQALRQDPNLFVAQYELARADLGLGDYKTAYNRLKQAERVSPDNPQIQTELQNLLAAHPQLLVEEEKEAVTHRQTAAAPRAVPLAGETTGMTTVRIGLAEQVKSLWAKTGGAFTLTTASGTKAITGNPQTILRFTFNPQGRIQAHDDRDRLLLESAEPVLLFYNDPSATTLLFQMEYGRGYFWAGQATRAYRGALQLLPFPAGMTIVNQLTMEEYLYAVVPSEMPSSWPAAALQAQAIAARTYAFANLGRYRQRGFDLLGSVASQAYNGVTGETAAVRKAVDATRGQILTYNGKPISAFYSANSGGYSAVPPATWNFYPPYLQAIPDKLVPAHNGLPSPATLADWIATRIPSYSSNPKYSARSAYRWRVIVPREEIERRLQNRAQIGQITRIITVGRASCGRVEHVLVQGTAGQCRISGDSIRSSLGGLRSNLFTVEPKLGPDGLPAFFIFSGAGFGHGVGLDQSGAAGMAADGFSTQDILAHYYPGTTITKLY